MISYPFTLGKFYFWTKSCVDLSILFDEEHICIGIATDPIMAQQMNQMFLEEYEEVSRKLFILHTEIDNKAEQLYYDTITAKNKIIVVSLIEAIRKGMKESGCPDPDKALMYYLGSNGYLKPDWLDDYKNYMGV